MSLRSNYETDPKKENDGIRYEMEDNEDGSIPFVILSRMSRSNVRYTEVLESTTKPYRVSLDAGTMKQAKQDKLFKSVFAETIVMSWGNILKSDVTGNPEDTGFIEYSKENALALFTAIPDIYTQWQAVANAAEGYRIERLKVEAKN